MWPYHVLKTNFYQQLRPDFEKINEDLDKIIVKSAIRDPHGRMFWIKNFLKKVSIYCHSDRKFAKLILVVLSHRMQCHGAILWRHSLNFCDYLCQSTQTQILKSVCAHAHAALYLLLLSSYVPLLTVHLLAIIGAVRYLYVDAEGLRDGKSQGGGERKSGEREKKKVPKISDEVVKLRCLKTLLGIDTFFI